MFAKLDSRVSRRRFRAIGAFLLVCGWQVVVGIPHQFRDSALSRVSFQTGQDTETRCKLFPVVLFDDSSDLEAIRQVLVRVHWFSSVCCVTGGLCQDAGCMCRVELLTSNCLKKVFAGSSAGLRFEECPVVGIYSREVWTVRRMVAKFMICNCG